MALSRLFFLPHIKHESAFEGSGCPTEESRACFDLEGCPGVSLSLLCLLHIHPRTGAQPQRSEPWGSGPCCPTSVETYCCEYWRVEVSQAPRLFWAEFLICSGPLGKILLFYCFNFQHDVCLPCFFLLINLTRASVLLLLQRINCGTVHFLFLLFYFFLVSLYF